MRYNVFVNFQIGADVSEEFAPYLFNVKAVHFDHYLFFLYEGGEIFRVVGIY